MFGNDCVVIDHWMHPRNLSVLDNPHGHVRITGPYGDTIELCICKNNNVINDAKFITDNCGTTTVAGNMANTAG